MRGQVIKENCDTDETERSAHLSFLDLFSFNPKQQTEAVRRGLQLHFRNEVLWELSAICSVVFYLRHWGFNFEPWWNRPKGECFTTKGEDVKPLTGNVIVVFSPELCTAERSWCPSADVTYEAKTVQCYAAPEWHQEV